MSLDHIARIGWSRARGPWYQCRCGTMHTDWPTARNCHPA